MAPIPTPEVLWRKPPVLALAALPGTALGRLGEPSTASAAAWAAAGAAARTLHDAPLPPWPGRSLDEIASRLDGECEWLITNGVLPAELVTRNRRIAEAALRPWTPVFTHGDLQVTHVFVDGDEITGVIDWSEAGRGDALYDLAILTLGHEEHLERRRRRLRDRRRPRRDPRVVVVAKPVGGPVADRARLRPLLAGLRVRRAQITAVMPPESDDRDPATGQPRRSPSGRGTTRVLVAFHDATTRPPARIPSRSTDAGVTSAVSPPTVTRARLPCTVDPLDHALEVVHRRAVGGRLELERDLPRSDQHRHGAVGGVADVDQRCRRADARRGPRRSRGRSSPRRSRRRTGSPASAAAPRPCPTGRRGRGR